MLSWTNTMTAICLTGAIAQMVVERHVVHISFPKKNESMEVDIEKSKKYAKMRNDLLLAWDTKDQQFINKIIRRYESMESTEQ